MAPEIGPEMMLAEWLSLESVADVRRRSHEPSARSRNELLGIAPLLRKLLLDVRSSSTACEPVVQMFRQTSAPSSGALPTTAETTEICHISFGAADRSLSAVLMTSTRKR